MANINKIKLSGTTYSIQDENATKTVELTQAQYDALAVKDPNTFYIITDATAGDLSNYYTKSETSGATQISTALASKQTTLTAGTGISIVDNVISATGGGGSITVDDALSTTSENPVQNKVVTAALNGKGESLQWDMTSSPMEYAQLRLQVNGNSISSANLFLGDYLQYGYPTSSALNITGLTPTTDFENHTADTAIHVTSAEKTSWNAKQDTLVSGTNIKTINNESILGEGNITIEGGGGGITVDDTLSSTSTNPVQNKVVKSATDRICRIWGYGTTGQTDILSWATGATSNYVDDYVQFSRINGKKIIGDKNYPTVDLSLIETSAITTSISSSSTDSQVPSAKAVYDQFGGLKLVKLTQSEYDALSTKDNSTLYVIVN